jgi:hypothetical protein
MKLIAVSKPHCRCCHARISPRPPFAVFGFWAGAPERIASIFLDLSKGGHPLVSLSVFLDMELSASAR